MLASVGETLMIMTVLDYHIHIFYVSSKAIFH